MRAILIDPFTQTVTETDYNGDFHHIYSLIGCDTFTVLEVGAGNVLYLDDEGLFKDLASQAFFGLSGYPNPLAGKGLILGTNDEGESIATRLTIEQVKRKVVWLGADHAKRHGEAGGFDGKIITDSGTVVPLPVGPLTDSRDEVEQARREAEEARKATEVAKAAMEAVREQAKKVVDQLNKAIEEGKDDDDQDD